MRKKFATWFREWGLVVLFAAAAVIIPIYRDNLSDGRAAVVDAPVAKRLAVRSEKDPDVLVLEKEKYTPSPTPLSVMVSKREERLQEYFSRETSINVMADLVRIVAEDVEFSQDVAGDFLLEDRRAGYEVSEALRSLDPRALDYVFAQVVVAPFETDEGHYGMTVRPLDAVSACAALPEEIYVHGYFREKLGIPVAAVGSKVLFAADDLSRRLEEPKIVSGRATYSVYANGVVSESGWGIEPDPTPTPKLRPKIAEGGADATTQRVPPVTPPPYRSSVGIEKKSLS